MKRKSKEDFIDQADIGQTGRFIVMLAGAAAGFFMKEHAEKAVKAFLIHRQIKLD